MSPEQGLLEGRLGLSSAKEKLQNESATKTKMYREFVIIVNGSAENVLIALNQS